MTDITAGERARVIVLERVHGNLRELIEQHIRQAEAAARKSALKKAALTAKVTCVYCAGRGYIPNEDATGPTPCPYCRPIRVAIDALFESEEP